MLKRGSALFFILVAIITVLAYAVIPHHHHESEICVISSHCETDNDAHKQETTGHKHDHDGDNNPDHCVLNQVFITPYNQIKQEFEYLDNANYDLQFDLLQAILYNKEFYGHFPIIGPNGQHHFLSSTYSCIASTSIGLRAPPIV